MVKTKNKSTKFYVYVDAEKYWEYLENGKNTDELFPDHFNEDTSNDEYSKYIESQLMPGEKYALLEDKSYDYAVTSYGRIFNCLYQREVWTYHSQDDVKVQIRSKRTSIKELFQELGWEFDLKILNKYAKKRK